MAEKFHDLLKDDSINDWKTLEEKIEAIETTVEKGDVFEQFAFLYYDYFKDLYQIDAIYSNKVLGHEITADLRTSLKLASYDDGVDGLYTTRDGRKTCYQVKFRSNRVPPTSNELNNFFAEAEYADSRQIFANCMSLPKDVSKRKNATCILGYRLDALSSEFFEEMRIRIAEIETHSEHKVRDVFRPRPYQETMIKDVLRGFEGYDRGKVIAACAAGKTLVSLWISERMDTKNVLFFTPNLALVRQTIEKWSSNASVHFRYLAVCSDESVGKGTDDSFTLKNDEIDISVTTDSDEIARFLQYESEEKKVVFSTYQSVDALVDALKKVTGFAFDLAIYDEAHRTVGTGSSAMFGKALLDVNVPAKKRLFMTATERLVSPRVRAKLEQSNKVVFSMDDVEKYGPTFSRLSFADAIGQGIVADYKVVVATMTNEEMFRLVESNRYLDVTEDGLEIIDAVAAQNLFKAALFQKVMSSIGATKAISFHSSISRAKDFTDLVQQLPVADSKSFISHINGSYSAAERADIFAKFENAPFSLISNVRCLIEGIDIPYIDAIMFADPRNSLIDIVQAVGRALRMPAGVTDKTSYIIVPALVDSETGQFTDDSFEQMHSVIQALRDQDERLADWIDKINVGVVTGKGGKGVGDGDSPIEIVLSESIDADDFYDSIAARISEVNGARTGSVGLGSTLGKSERGSSKKRLFKTICDYNYVALRESLVDPTIERFPGVEAKCDRSAIAINNNNVSHTMRLGLIEKVGKQFVLTDLGKRYKLGEIEFLEMFKHQVLVHESGTKELRIHPYRIALEALSVTKQLNYHQFLYGLYSIDSSSHRENVEHAIVASNYIAESYPNISMATPENHELIRQSLNDAFGLEYSVKDVWTDRTTIGNQYRFFLNHISVFPDCFEIDFSKKTVLDADRDKIINLLDWSAADAGVSYEYEYVSI